jgi:enoyl-CoA hydratase/carnithine racemase
VGLDTDRAVRNDAGLATEEQAAQGALTVDDASGVRTLTLVRPRARNALTEAMLAALHEEVARAARDVEVRALVLTGSGTAFCAGADLGRFDGPVDQAAFRFESHRLTELVGLLERVEKPVIAAVNGVAVGLGVQLALACDLRVAAESASFAFTEGRLGLLPTHGDVARLVKLVGLARARDLLLGSATIDARRAHELGLLTEIVPDGELAAAAARLAADALRRAPQSYGLTKRLLLLAASADLTSSMTAETIAQSLLVGTEDHAEGLRAARERRPPEFTGR